VAVFFGGQDIITSPTDSLRLLEELIELANVVHVQYEEEYAHMDFVWAKDANGRIYDNIVHLVNRFTQEKEKEVRHEEEKAAEREEKRRHKESMKKKKKKSKKKKRRDSASGKVKRQQLQVTDV